MKFSLASADWKAAINHVKRALSKDSARPILENLKYECDGKETLRIIAMNSTALHTALIPIHIEEPCSPFDFIAPIPLIGKTDTIVVDYDGEKAAFGTDDGETVLICVPGEYLAWTNVVPENAQVPQFYLNVSKLQKAISGLPRDAIVGFHADSAKSNVLIGSKGFFAMLAPVNMGAAFTITP